MKRIAALVLCTTLTVGTLAGCGQRENPYLPTGDGLYSEGETLPVEEVQTKEQVTIPYDPQNSLNPFEATDLINRSLMSLLYQGLFIQDQDHQTWPILCESYRISWDLKTYHFTLAQATFSDGSAVTAEDVTASLKKAANSPAYEGRFQQVEKISVTDNGEVQIKLKTPCESLLTLLDIPIVKASQVDSSQPLGSGPYLFQAGSPATLQRRTDWWCNTGLPVTANRIVLMEAENPAQLRDAFEFAGLSLVPTDPGSQSYTDFHSDYELWECESGIFLYLGCNKNSPVFGNDDLRQSLVRSIDRDKIVSQIYRGFAAATVLPAVPGSPYYSTALAKEYAYDSMYLAQAVEDNREVAENLVTLLVNSDDGIRLRAAHLIAQDLQTCGLKVTVQGLPTKDYTKALKDGAYDLYLGQTRLSANMDLTAFFAKDGSLNVGDMADPATYALCLEALANVGNYYNLHQRILEDGQLCPIAFRSYAIYTRRGIFQSLNPSRDHLFFYHLNRTCDQALITEE